MTEIAFAQETATAQPSFLENLIPFLFIFVAMYFLMIRPQTKKAKEQSEFLKNLKLGDEVITSSGIIGKIRFLGEDHIALDLGSAQLKVTKDHIVKPYQKKQP